MCKRSSFISDIKYILCLMLDSMLPWHTQRSYKRSDTRPGGGIALADDKRCYNAGPDFTWLTWKAELGSDYFLAFHCCQLRAASAPPNLQNGITLLAFHCCCCWSQCGKTNPSCPVIIPVWLLVSLCLPLCRRCPLLCCSSWPTLSVSSHTMISSLTFGFFSSFLFFNQAWKASKHLTSSLSDQSASLLFPLPKNLQCRPLNLLHLIGCLWCGWALCAGRQVSSDTTGVYCA